MATFVVSLFLPYTIEFCTPPDKKYGGEGDYIEDDHQQQPPALLRRASATSSRVGTIDSIASPQPHRSIRKCRSAAQFQHPNDPHSIRHADSLEPDWDIRGRYHRTGLYCDTEPLPSPNILDEGIQDPFESHSNLERHWTDGTRDMNPTMASDDPHSLSSWSVAPSVHSNGGLVNAVRAAIDEIDIASVLWLGTLGRPTDMLTLSKKNEVSDHLRSEYDSIPVYPTDAEFDAHFNHFCKTILWPVLHYQQSYVPKSNAYASKAWEYYKKVNIIFAERIVQSYKHGDSVWVNDYHLMLVPNLVREKIPDARILFFMHTPFPSSELFRCLAERVGLLNGVLGANIVSFQTPEYVRHFLQACSRILVVEATENGVRLDDRFVDLISSPLGIVRSQLAQALAREEVTRFQGEILERYKDKKILVSRTKLDITRGVRQSLLAYQKFLDNKQGRKDDTVFILITQVTNSETGSSYAETVYKLVNNINARYSSLSYQPITFLQQDISYAEYLALLSCADVFIVSSLREGLNLSSYDFIMSQFPRANAVKCFGRLILSEFTGASTILECSDLTINPWDTTQFAQIIHTSLNTATEVRGDRHRRLLDIVCKKDGISWARELLSRVHISHENNRRRENVFVPRLSMPSVSNGYSVAADRLMFLDYEGTLSPWGAATTAFSGAPQRAIDTLRELQAPQNNMVYVTSNMNMPELERIFRHVADLGLIAGDGCFVKAAGSDDWTELADFKKIAEWKNGVKPILKHYASRIEASRINEHVQSLTLDYSNTSLDQLEAAARQAGECANHINESCKSWRIRAVPVDKAVVIESIEFSKVAAAEWVLHRHRKTKAELECGTAFVKDVLCRMQSLTSEKGDPDMRNTEEATSDRGTSRSRKSAIRSPIPELSPLENDFSIDFPEPPKLEPARQRPWEARAERWSIAPKPVNIPQRPQPAKSRGSYGSDSAIDSPEALMSPISAIAPIPDVATSIQGLDPYDYYKLPDNLNEFSPDFLFVAGDGREDEPLFRWANDLSGSKDGTGKIVRNVFTVCVGEKSTEAQCAVTSGPMGMLTVLQKLARLCL